ncbi:PepSY domain-containing protein [Cryobacterium frigoriphilum]|uniref:PepSY domain-containing protein n=1 Tax=Cryobacterium frigoriphilum TaxID=1259150 RepID=UPI001580314D|nr:PepSY domain-containing protein [Cryobacterium frigoriphilum]
MHAPEHKNAEQQNTKHESAQNSIRIATALAGTVALAAGGVLLLGTSGAIGAPGKTTGSATSEGPDVAITGGALDQASAAALAHTGDGVVTETEMNDEESYYEVEVTLSSGAEVDVQLDQGFAVVGSEPENSSGHENSSDE